ncbi:MAG: tetratricopeptide repeat protein [Gemmatimonadota bacterium]|nr:tetratricopeptide repeat protein [Gemmatimonadota bacterium]
MRTAMPNRQEIAAKAVAKAKVYFRKRQYEQALAACDRAIKTDPNACEAYEYRWLALREILAPDEIGRTINPEVESFLATHVESPEVLFAAYEGYMTHPDRTKNVPDSLFKRMLAYPGTDAMLTALLGLAERSQDPREKWAYNRCVIDEFTASGISHSYLSWYWGRIEIC